MHVGGSKKRKKQQNTAKYNTPKTIKQCAALAPKTAKSATTTIILIINETCTQLRDQQTFNLNCVEWNEQQRHTYQLKCNKLKKNKQKQTNKKNKWGATLKQSRLLVVAFIFE